MNDMFNSLSLSPTQKMDKLVKIATIISENRNEEGEIPEPVKHFCHGALTIVGECHESWCDNCPVKQQVGMLCSDWLSL